MRKMNLTTTNREIYEKLNMLNYTPEVLIKEVKPSQLMRIINNINTKEKILTMEKIGEYFLIKKVNKINNGTNFNIYLK